MPKNIREHFCPNLLVGLVSVSAKFLLPSMSGSGLKVSGGVVGFIVVWWGVLGFGTDLKKSCESSSSG